MPLPISGNPRAVLPLWIGGNPRLVLPLWICGHPRPVSAGIREDPRLVLLWISGTAKIRG